MTVPFWGRLPEEAKHLAEAASNTQVFFSRPEMIVREFKGRGQQPHPDPAAVKDAIVLGGAPWAGAVLGKGSGGSLITTGKLLKAAKCAKSRSWQGRQDAREENGRRKRQTRPWATRPWTPHRGRPRSSDDEMGY